MHWTVNFIYSWSLIGNIISSDLKANVYILENKFSVTLHFHIIIIDLSFDFWSFFVLNYQFNLIQCIFVLLILNTFVFLILP